MSIHNASTLSLGPPLPRAIIEIGTPHIIICSAADEATKRTSHMIYTPRGRKRVRRAERREPSGTSFLYRQADACRSPIVSLMNADVAWSENGNPERTRVISSGVHGVWYVRTDQGSGRTSCRKPSSSLGHTRIGFNRPFETGIEGTVLSFR